MNAWFADTSYFLALISPNDVHHQKAVALSRERSVPLVTTSWVITELANGMSRPPWLRGVFGQVLESIQSDPTATVVPADETLFRRGLELYRDRDDKEWSLTDCISFIVMQDRELSEALTSDHHFEQAGFTVLLK